MLGKVMNLSIFNVGGITVYIKLTNSIRCILLHKKWSFPLKISTVNATKSAGNCGWIWSHLPKKSLMERFIFLCSAFSLDSWGRLLNRPMFLKQSYLITPPGEYMIPLHKTCLNLMFYGLYLTVFYFVSKYFLTYHLQMWTDNGFTCSCKYCVDLNQKRL